MKITKRHKRSSFVLFQVAFVPFVYVPDLRGKAELFCNRLDRHDAQFHWIHAIVDDAFNRYRCVHGNLRAVCGAHQKKLVFAGDEEWLVGMLLDAAASASVDLGDSYIGFLKDFSGVRGWGR